MLKFSTNVDWINSWVLNLFFENLPFWVLGALLTALTRAKFFRALDLAYFSSKLNRKYWRTEPSAISTLRYLFNM